MITLHEDKNQNFLEIIVRGKISQGDLQGLAGDLIARTEGREHIRLLEVIEDFAGMEPKAVLEDIKFGLSNIGVLKKFDKCAVVADEKWIRALTNFSEPFVGIEMKTFNTDQKAEAREWLLH